MEMVVLAIVVFNVGFYAGVMWSRRKAVETSRAADRLASECERIGTLAGSIPWDVGAALDAYRKTEKKQVSASPTERASK